MTDDSQSMEDFFAQYDDLACSVIDDERPNIHVGIELSNADMTEAVCEIMDWESFDLFDDMPFEDIYTKGAAIHILAYCYIAFLRWELWLAAGLQKVGDADFNEKAAAHSELWYLRMRDKYHAMLEGEMTEHPWIH